MRDLGSRAAMRVGSSPFRRTTSEQASYRLLRLIFISQNALILLLPLSHSDPLRWAHSGRTALWKAFFRYREGCPFQINSPTSSEQLVYSSEEVGLFSAKPRYIKDWLLPYF